MRKWLARLLLALFLSTTFAPAAQAAPWRISDLATVRQTVVETVLRAWSGLTFTLSELGSELDPDG